jgi:outer membrane receptor protein involved in Fe transport
MGSRSPRPSARIATAVREVLRALPICVPAALAAAPAPLPVAPDALSQPTAPVPLLADIPAQPLAQALAAFAAQTGLQLVYVSGLVRDQKSHAARAGLAAPQALARLLEGTGLRFEFLTADSIRILAATTALKPSKATDAQADEIIVTANRRNESVQNVPITIQVLTSATLAKINATTFDDFLNFLPGVTAHGVGPAQNNIYVRGLGTSDDPLQAAGANGVFPNVAVYIDEQSAQLPSRNLDVYAADLERIEVLEGPQGTLFGAGAQAGVLRYITKKPNLDVTEAAVNAGYAVTAHGDPSTAADAMVNIPIIDGTFAVRGVIYDEKRGGYINNPPATFARSAADASIAYAGAGGQVPANSLAIDNSSIAGNHINTVSYKGIRVEALYRFNDDWNLLLAQSYQDIDVQGVFTEEAADWQGAPQPPLSVQMFNPSFDKDRFENTALTVQGALGPLSVLYAGSYLVRNVDQVQDYTNYAHGGPYADYYQCVNPGPTPASARCFTPSATWRDLERNTHQSHELRLTTPADWSIRGVGGLFYEDYRILDQSDWFYLTALPYFNPIGPPTGYYTANGKVYCACTAPSDAVFVPGAVTSVNPNVRPLGDGFFNDVTRGYSQKAAFASVDLDLVPHALTLTGGTRYFKTTSSEVGSLVGSFGCGLINYPAAPNPCLNQEDATNLNALGLERTFSGFRSRANLSWKVTGEVLLYYTWSQGFRAGGFNRGFGLAGNSPLAPGQGSWQAQAKANGGYNLPLTFAPDNLTNYEIGWKSSWWDQRFHWNGTLYQENWDNAQIGQIDLLGDAIVNGGNYRVRGIETSGTVRLASGLTLDFGANWNHTELVKQATFYWTNGTPVNFNGLTTANGAPFPNPAGAVGRPLAAAPPFQENLRARYEFDVNGYRAFIQLGAAYQSHSLANLALPQADAPSNSKPYGLPSFTIYDGSLGIGRDAWIIQLYGQNLSDNRAETYANYNLYYEALTVSRPRTLGLRLTYKFGHR